MGQTVAKSPKPPDDKSRKNEKSKKDKAPGDLFAGLAAPPNGSGRRNGRTAPRGTPESGYTAKHIEVLEGLEPVRRRPGMYIGGTDETALHHLFAEVIDNAMDEALAGHAHFIEVEVEADGYISVYDNGRGIPVDPHPKFPKKSALEVIMCTLHAGGKSVVNALSERVEVEVARGGQLYRQVFQRGKPKSGLEQLGKVANRRGTRVRYKHDPEIFGKAKVNPQRLFKMAR